MSVASRLGGSSIPHVLLSTQMGKGGARGPPPTKSSKKSEKVGPRPTLDLDQGGLPRVPLSDYLTNVVAGTVSYAGVDINCQPELLHTPLTRGGSLFKNFQFSGWFLPRPKVRF